jgi:hypothetical protein
MATRAVQDGTHWVLNGRKLWVSYMPQADFTIVLARTAAGGVHIPTKPAGYPEVMSATHSNLIAATVPISSRPGDAVSSGRFW